MAKRLLDWTATETEKAASVSAVTRGLAQALEPINCAFVELERPLIGAPRGALAHMPYVASDMFALPDRAPTCGMGSMRKALVTGHASILKRLDGAGAVRLGLTETTALGLDPAGINARREQPRNPWDVEFAPGGASSGAGVAVASGGACLALGQDTFGDLRIAAHCLGVTAWKPTRGLLATDAALVSSPSLATIGLIARSARDIERAQPALLDGEATLPLPIGRVLVFRDVLASAEPRVRKACRDGLDALELAGLMLEQRPGGAAIAAVERRAMIVQPAEVARSHRALLDAGALDDDIRARLAPGLAITDAELAAAIRDHRRLWTDFSDAFFTIADAIALPVMSLRAPPVAECDPEQAGFHPHARDAMTALTRFANYLGLPAVAVPVGLDDRGLPVALQVVGRPGSDLALLAIAAHMQEKSAWHGLVPAGVADVVTQVPELAA